MKRIEEIDKNFAVKTECTRENVTVYSVLNEPFSIHGLIPPKDKNDLFRRMPNDIAISISEGVNALHTNCAGGRVRFKTDSKYIAIEAVLGNVGKMPHFTLTGTAGFDMYSGTKHIVTFQPKFDIENKIFGEIIRKDSGLKDFTLNFPLYSEVKELYIILDKDAVVSNATDYRQTKPVVFYGSSITQGGCASRPGTAYHEILSRRLDFDYVNLGFAGSAKGEKEMCDYIAGLDMSAFVFDYDHNAPNTEHLKATHEPFFKTIRNAHQNIPIICVTAPTPCFDDREERKQIIKTTVENAVISGDGKVFYLDMSDYIISKGILEEASVDRCHPNDLGFYYMAEAIEKILKITLK